MQPQTAEGVVGGRYRVDGQLGQGGMARVFDAFDERLERRVAVKILHPETEAIPGMRKRFQQEARIAAQLIHPNIVAVLDYGEDAESCYLVMERLPGRTLRDEMAAGPLPLERAAVVITETLSALAAAHRFGVLHRDIKPSNILLQEDGHIKITDFGIAKSFDLNSDVPDDVTQTGVVLGTPGYLAPERRTGQAATVQSDIYSVGAVMVEALSGQRPHSDGADLATLPADLRAVASSALASDPRDRFASAESMLSALKEADSAAPAASLAAATVAMTPMDGTIPIDATSEDPTRTAALFAPPVVPPPTPRHKVSRKKVILAAVLAVMLLVIILVTLSTSGGSPSGPPASATSHHNTAPRDPERTAIRSLASSVASDGLPGDSALASALRATAAEPAGPARQAAGTQALALGAVLVAGGGISSAQYQDVISILQPTGATVPTTTTTAPPAPAPKPKGPGGHHGPGGDQG